jgi:hypothetical protein
MSSARTTRSILVPAVAVLVALVAAACGGARPRGSLDPMANVASGAGGDVTPTPQPAPTMSSPEEYGDRPISVEAGAEYFLHTGGGDPYAAGLAYPIFLAFMEAYPDELGRDWNELAERFGLIPDPAAKGDPKAPPIGFHLTTDPNTHVPWLVANCQLCHAERLRLPSGDVVVAGLGNKNVRAHAYAAALSRVANDPRLEAGRITELATRRARAWNVAWPENVRRAIVDATLPPFKSLAAKRASAVKRLDAALPGRIATVESFAMVLNDKRETPISLPDAIGWTKVPDVRSFPFRDTFSYDASGYGSPQALVLDADFVFGARPEWYASHPHIATSAYLYLKSFSRKLPFPKPVDAALAGHGKQVFESRCAGCHGFYVAHGDEMRVSYRERVIPKEVVGTDPARVDAITPSYVEAANDVPLVHGHARVRNTGGYVPPVLLDVWARGLFGHAGQWPSLEALATPPGDRPRAFVVDTNGLYDLDRVGVRYEVVKMVAGAPQRAEHGKLVPRPLKRGEYLYEGEKAGYRVEGHPFLSDLPERDRRAVIEYLKTLSSK